MKEAVIERPVSPTVRLTTWVLISGLVAIFVGGYWLKIEIVARGQGKVIPVSRVQLVQPKTNGRIIRILVTEGQPVKAGDLLVGMDTVSVESQIKLRLTEVRRQRRGATVARVIIAALTNVAVANDDVLAAGRAAFERERHDLEVIDGAEALIEAVLTSLRDQVARINAQLDRVEQSRITQQARLQKARSDLDISSRKFLSAGKLKDKGAISEVDYFERLREQRARELEVLISESELNILAAEANALARQRQSIISTAVENYQKQLNEASTSLAGLEAELSAARNQLALLAIRAPADGKVENLTVFTIGGFVEAGSTLMSIVPSGDGMEIEAFFDNRDIGFLEKGQEAFVKFDAFPAERFGIVRGRVTRVGADARGDIVPGKWVYAIHLVLDQETIGIGGRDIGFSPGMTATIDVITGERRLISYFFEPIIKAIQDGLGER
ncbi:HlyD family type I secretion periplasmic adaptor subunit [Sinorhizobium meliloti]|uniref:HlyD family type I secretion periplasmic adaptor subunit n=1 Tax=Rhizobium meliloti TaxID=382 RepID=UPI000FDA695E|nr:HlyD family type I secretion periplasmic adaptor subunit [Sinorhizobium meliloti]RVO91851.1 HlyD family type I secretion periplasmic adaptor subunit [Sinorhizobium meliloti]RVQ19170.1 HlyD family type I secretion periplasmic adaptor subunit [Sinorhizobium meliloti]